MNYQQNRSARIRKLMAHGVSREEANIIDDMQEHIADAFFDRIETAIETVPYHLRLQITLMACQNVIVNAGELMLGVIEVARQNGVVVKNEMN